MPLVSNLITFGRSSSNSSSCFNADQIESAESMSSVFYEVCEQCSFHHDYINNKSFGVDSLEIIESERNSLEPSPKHKPYNFVSTKFLFLLCVTPNKRLNDFILIHEIPRGKSETFFSGNHS